MSLVCLAIVGKENEPLYCRSLTETGNEDDADDNDKAEQDHFGFSSVERPVNDSLSLEQEFMMHAALDRLDEVLQENRAGGARWLGKLCPMEDFDIYGYASPTCTKFLGMVRSPADPSRSIRESELKLAFAKIHELFVQYTLNPFSNLRDKINSDRFDEGVMVAVQLYNDQDDRRMASV